MDKILQSLEPLLTRALDQVDRYLDLREEIHERMCNDLERKREEAIAKRGGPTPIGTRFGQDLGL